MELERKDLINLLLVYDKMELLYCADSNYHIDDINKRLYKHKENYKTKDQEYLKQILGNVLNHLKVSPIL